MNLDQQIRAWIDTYRNAYRDGDSRRLAHAIRAVLDLPPMATPGPVRDQRSQTAEWMAAGYNQALADVRVEIADRLGIAAPTDTDWSTDARSPAPTPDKPPTATLEASTGHPCDAGLPEPAAPEEALCPATHPSARPPARYTCTQTGGHAGPHLATGIGGRSVLAEWTDPCGDVLIGEITCILTPGHQGDHHADTAAGNCDWGDHGTLTTQDRP